MFKRKDDPSGNEMNKSRPKKMTKKIVASVAGVAVTGLVGTQILTVELPAKSELYGQQYQTVQKQFEELGFEHFSTVGIEDLKYGKTSEAYPVEVVTVDGEAWKEGRVLKSAAVAISYHTPVADAVELDFPTSQDVKGVEQTLKQSGFKTIKITPILLLEKGNEDKKDKIDSLQIGEYTYQPSYFYSTSLPVSITYYDVSKENIKLPENITSVSYKQELDKILKASGFTDIKWKKVEDKDKSKHEKIKKITLGDETLTPNSKLEIISKRTIPISVEYFDFSSFAELPTTLSMKTLTDTKKLFSDGGFTQISEEASETTDIAKNGQISDVLIDGKLFKDINDVAIKKDSKIVIKYWNAEKAIAEKARKEEEERQAAEAKRLAEEQAAAQAQEAAQSQEQIHGFAQAPASNVYYPNCKAVRAAGAAPISQGQPGYGRHLDRDGDGTGCE